MDKENKVRRDLAAARLALGRDAIISEAEAVRLLPGQDAKVRKWLRDNHLVSEILGGRPCVLWGNVVDAFKRQSKSTTNNRSKKGNLPRFKLD